MDTYKRHRFPPAVISYAVWLYYRFNRSHRDIADLLAERGIIVSYESIRLWVIKFGCNYSALFSKKPKKVLDTVFLKIAIFRHHLCGFFETPLLSAIAAPHDIQPFFAVAS